MTEILADGLFGDTADSTNVFQEIAGDVVPLLQVFQTVVREPDFAIGVFPDQSFERQV
jgi:hypothetical protein